MNNLKSSSLDWFDTYIPDPVELMESRINRIEDKFIDEFTCMECGNRYDYEMTCVSPLGDGPIVCNECLGFDPFEELVK